MALGQVNVPGAAGMDAVEAKQAAQAAKEAAEAAQRTAESAGARRQSELLLASESLYSLTLPVPRAAGDFMRRSPLCLQNND